MKKWMAMLVAVLLAAAMLCGAALAEAAEFPQDMVIPEGTQTQLDLDGDGKAETVSWETLQPDEYTDQFVLTVTPEGGEALTFEPEYFYITGVYAADLDGDGATELLMSGDEASDDYLTYCLRLRGGKLEPALFADAFRSVDNSGYYKYGYGMITGIEDNRVTLSGSQDVLGTWFATRVYALEDNGLFEFADEGEWVRDMDISELDDEFWDEAYACLTVKKALTYTAADGAEAELPVGAKLLVTASDKQTYARFITRDGVTGTLDICPDFDRGWGMRVNDEPEADWFEMIPYAD